MYKRFSIIVVLVFAVYAGAYYFWQNSNGSSLNEVFLSMQRERAAAVETLVKQQEQTFIRFAADYSLGDDVVRSVEEDSVWNPGHSDAILSSSGVESVWLFNTDLHCVTTFSPKKAPGVPEYYSEPFFMPRLRIFLRGAVSGHFYQFSDEGVLCEVAFAPVQPESDSARVTAPKGFLVAVRKWTPEFCGAIAKNMDAEVSVIPAQGHVAVAAGNWKSGTYSVEHIFSSSEGDPVGYLVARYRVPILLQSNGIFFYVMLWVVGGAGILCLAVLLGGYMAFGSKVTRLLSAMRIGDMRILGDADERSGDYAQLARTVELAYLKRNTQQAASMEKGKVTRDEKFLDILLKYFAGIVLVISRDGILTHAEGRDVALFGIQKDRDLGRPISNILRGQARLEQFEGALRGKRSNMEQKVGDHIYETTCEPVTGAKGVLDYVVVISVDVTDKHQSDDILTRAKSEAARAERIKTQFLSVVSHETRTPLNGVLGFASVLRETPLNEEQTSYLDRIVDSGQKMLRILSDIIDLTRLEAGEKQVNVEPLSLQSLVYQLAERYRLACHKKEGLEFIFDIDQRLPDLIASDNEMITRVLSNILENAVKFTDVGKVKFSAAWVQRDGKSGHSGVMFSVSDTGPGIAPEIARNLFEPFHQGDSSNTREHGGLGIGLTIAHKLVSQLQGRLTFETKLDVGTTFYFFLPSEPVEEEEAVQRSPRF